MSEDFEPEIDDYEPQLVGVEDRSRDPQFVKAQQDRDALEAFHGEWDKCTAGAALALWEPAATGANPSIGLSVHNAAYERVVTVSPNGNGWRLSAGREAASIDLSTAARMLNMPATEARAVLDSAASGLRAAQRTASEPAVVSAAVSASFSVPATGAVRPTGVPAGVRRAEVHHDVKAGLER